MIILKLVLALVVYLASLSREVQDSVKWLANLPKWILRVLFPIALISAVFLNEIIESLSPKPLTLTAYGAESAGPNANIDSTKRDVREMAQWLRDSIPRIQYDRSADERVTRVRTDYFSYSYGVVAKKLGAADYRGALAALEIALRFSSDKEDTVMILSAVSASYISIGQMDSATRSLDVGLSLDTTDGALWNNRGVLLELTGRQDDAIICYGKAIRFSTTDYTAYLNRGMLLEKQGKFSAAQEDYFAATRVNDKAAVAWNNLGALEGRRDNSKALPMFRRAIESDSSYALAWFNVGTALARIGRADSAITYIERSCRLNPGHFNSWFNLGIQYRVTGKLQKAVHAFSVCISLNPSSKFAQNSLAEALLQVGRLDEALPLLRNAASLDSFYCGAWINLANALMLTGLCDSAVVSAQHAVKCDDQEPAAWQILAAVKYVCAHDLRGADSAADVALQLQPGMPQALRLKSDIASKRTSKR